MLLGISVRAVFPDVENAKILEQGIVLYSFQWEAKFIFYNGRDVLLCPFTAQLLKMLLMWKGAESLKEFFSHSLEHMCLTKASKALLDAISMMPLI